MTDLPMDSCDCGFCQDTIVPCLELASANDYLARTGLMNRVSAISDPHNLTHPGDSAVRGHEYYVNVIGGYPSPRLRELYPSIDLSKYNNVLIYTHDAVGLRIANRVE